MNHLLTFAREELNKHNLTDWSVCVDRAKRRLGQCRYREKEIGISENHLRDSSEEDIKETVLHEIAHALAGPNHGHDHVWKQWAVKLGVSPKSTGNAKISRDDAPYLITCENSCWEYPRYKNTNQDGRQCKRCHGKVLIKYNTIAAKTLKAARIITTDTVKAEPIKTFTETSGKDKYGCGRSSGAGKINAMLENGATLPELVQGSGRTATSVINHLSSLRKKGFEYRITNKVYRFIG